MVRMVRSLADRTFQLGAVPGVEEDELVEGQLLVRVEVEELEDLQRHREDLGEPTAARRSRHDEPKLKGSIGEGPNHSNFSDQSSVRIQEIC